MPVLPEDMQCEGLLALIEEAWPMFGLRREVKDTLRAELRRTRPADFKHPQREPCCYQQQGEIAGILGVSRETVHRHESAWKAPG